MIIVIKHFSDKFFRVVYKKLTIVEKIGKKSFISYEKRKKMLHEKKKTMNLKRKIFGIFARILKDSFQGRR